MKIQAELSLYPLRTDRLDDVVEHFFKGLPNQGISISPGDMSTRLIGESEDIFRAVARGFLKAGESDEVVLVAKFSNAGTAQDAAGQEQEGVVGTTIHLDETRCTGCGVCVDVCPLGAIRVEGVAVIDAAVCDRCGACAAACPNQALSIEGGSLIVSSSDTPAPPSPRVPPPERGTATGSHRAVEGGIGSQPLNKRGLLGRILDFFEGPPDSNRTSGSGRGMGGGRGQGMGGGRGKSGSRGGGVKGGSGRGRDSR